MPREFLITARQTAKIINAFTNNIPTDIKLSKAQISKIIQSGGFLCNMLSSLSKNKITDLSIPLACNNLTGLLRNLATNAKKWIWKKNKWKGTVRAGKIFTLFISNEDVNDIIKILKSLENAVVLIDGVTETVKQEIKKKKVDFLELC